MTPKQIALRTAWAYHGRPYRWGGDDPLAGFDCSGFVIECLRAAGRLPPAGDWTAAGLFVCFNRPGAPVLDPCRGCLVFWGNPIHHVELCLDAVYAIGASGGGSGTLTVGDAIKQNAYIKVRPFRSRPGIYGYVDPFAG